MGITEIRSSLGTQSDLQSRKIEILESILRRNERYEFESPILAEIGGVRLSLRFAGVDAKGVTTFLKKYFLAFAPRTTDFKPEISFDIITPAGKDFEESNPLWNDPDENFNFHPLCDGNPWTVQRDFAGGKIAPGLVRSYMPCPTENVTDGIDNLLVTFLPELLLKKNVFPLHAATVEKNGQAYVFFGASGAGKSTLASYCAGQLGLRILSGDQIYVHYDEQKNGLFAIPCSTTVADYPRNHPKLLVEPRPIAGFIHLVRLGDWSFRELSTIEAMRLFLREICCPKGIGNAELILAGVNRIFERYSKNWIEMSYPKHQDFWPKLESSLKERPNHV